MDKIYISEHDRDQLLQLVEEHQAARTGNRESLGHLLQELKRAVIVKPEAIPGDVITMRSVVRFKDLESNEELVYTLVFPQDANLEDHRISVLAPVGTAMIGYRIGDIIEWKVPAGIRRLQVESILYQPEASV